MSEVPATLVNGEPDGGIPATDRGLLFGDGVFETLAVRDGAIRFWERHMARLQAGCHRLGIAHVDTAVLHEEAQRLIQAVPGSGDGVLKVIMTRGAGTRGYRPDSNAVPTRILQLHAWPDLPVNSTGVHARMCSLRLGHNPALAGIKHLNRLEQVLARAEWTDESVGEGLMLDQAGRVIEGTMSNLFLAADGALLTPDLTRCGVAGIQRDIVREIGISLGYEVRVQDVLMDRLFQADELFICNSLIGVCPVISVDSNRYPVGEITASIMAGLRTFETDRPVWNT